jgi:hypothetical protein
MRTGSFQIVSLYWPQRGAQIATATERGVTEVIPALVQSREQVPGLKTMRDVGSISMRSSSAPSETYTEPAKFA